MLESRRMADHSDGLREFLFSGDIDIGCTQGVLDDDDSSNGSIELKSIDSHN